MGAEVVGEPEEDSEGLEVGDPVRESVGAFATKDGNVSRYDQIMSEKYRVLMK